ncbi:hypothetical protein CLBKND_01352 [Methylorubrum aminovorans]
MESMLLSLIDRTVLLGIVASSILAQVFAVARLGPHGAWVARRYALWGVALFGIVVLILSDLIFLSDSSPIATLIGSQTHAVLLPFMLSYLGACLVVLTLSGGVVSGLSRLFRRGVPAAARDSTS